MMAGLSKRNARLSVMNAGLSKRNAGLSKRMPGDRMHRLDRPGRSHGAGR
jgi:hypothetical protein